jgi:hypothetical protein
MFKSKNWMRLMGLSMALLLFVNSKAQQPVSIWLFDEAQGLYPSSVLENSSQNDYPMVLGLGGKIVPGKFGNALEVSGVLHVDLPKGDVEFGLADPVGTTSNGNEVLTWKNANFAALMTSGTTHLRNQVGFADASKTKLNLGNFDWTVECWLQLNPGATGMRYIFEMGIGQLMGESKTTSLYIDPATGQLVFTNDAASWKLSANSLAKSNQWQHVALVYDAKSKQLSYYLNGKKAAGASNVNVQSLPQNKENYFTKRCV